MEPSFADLPLAADQDFVAAWRKRLGSLSWLMKDLKEPPNRPLASHHRTQREGEQGHDGQNPARCPERSPGGLRLPS